MKAGPGPRALELDQLRTLLRFPSVSAHPARRAVMDDCARWLGERCRRGGLPDVTVRSYGGPPLVIARSASRRDRPTVLLYAHYDVVPAEPLDAWRTEPFEPAVVAGFLLGRGASDNKGQLWAHLLAIAHLHRRGALPVNVIAVLDGEEEIGSPHLPTALVAEARSLRPDAVVVSDTRMAGPDRPAITVALRGSIGLDIEVTGLPRELHAGAFGGAVPNPLHSIGSLVASFHDCRGRVAVAGFHDGIPPLGRREVASVRATAPSIASFRRAAGGAPLLGDDRLGPYERSVLLPALNVTGIAGGYTGPGVKSAIAVGGSVRLNVRLVPGQDPDEVTRRIAAHITRTLPRWCRADVRVLSRSAAVVADPDHPAVGVASRAYERVFGRAPLIVRSGGSIPALAHIRAHVRAPLVLMGFAQHDDGMHAPNERFSVRGLHQAAHTCVAFYDGFGATAASAT